MYHTPIWDVLAPGGEQEEAGEHLSMHSRCLAFQIRQVVLVGQAQTLDHCWAHCSWFFVHTSSYVGSPNVSKYITSCHMHPGGLGWVDGNRWVWMSFPF